MCSSFLWLKCSNIQPKRWLEPPPPPPKTNACAKAPSGSSSRRAKESWHGWRDVKMCWNDRVFLGFHCFPPFPCFFGKIQLQVNNNRQSKTGLPTWQLSQTVNTCLKKKLKSQTDLTKEYIHPAKLTAKAPEDLRNHPFLLGHGLVLGASYQRLPSPSPNSINGYQSWLFHFFSARKMTRKNRTLPSFPSFIVL